MNILIVDDSVVFRSQIKTALEIYPEIKSITTAANGRIALSKLEQSSIDIMILDLEMPELDGMETLRLMRERGFRQKVIVFAASSASGASKAMDALKLGAADFVTKPQGGNSLDESLERVRQELVPKILQFRPVLTSAPKELPKREAYPSASPPPKAEPKKYTIVSIHTFKPSALAIGCSTGGPGVLEKIFPSIKGRSLRVPIFLVQHMPPVFTANLAKRLSDISGHPAAEGRHGELVAPGRIYVAPGDYHMTIGRLANQKDVAIRLDQSQKRNSVRPAVDNLFESCVSVYSGMIGSMILTGMGEDGLQGALKIKGASGGVMIQNEASSVVWGMPGSVFHAGAYDEIGSIEECAACFANMVT
jgi:two-component system chemotaxis response regulator CheB